MDARALSRAFASHDPTDYQLRIKSVDLRTRTLRARSFENRCILDTLGGGFRVTSSFRVGEHHAQACSCRVDSRSDPIGGVDIAEPG